MIASLPVDLELGLFLAGLPDPLRFLYVKRQALCGFFIAKGQADRYYNPNRLTIVH